MGALIQFELKKILGNKAGMVSCALVLVMLVAMTALNYATSKTHDVHVGEVAYGAEARARVEKKLGEGFWGHFPYTDAEKAFWHSLEDGIRWPMEYGYERGWHDVLRWKGFSGLAVIAVCIAISGVFAGEYRDRTAAIVFLGVLGLFVTPAAKIALLTSFSGLSYAYDSMVSYAMGPFVADLPTMLAAVYGFMLVVLAPLAATTFGHASLATSTCCYHL